MALLSVMPRDFSVLINAHTDCVPSCSVGTGSHCYGLKGPGRESDHVPSSNAEARNVWRYIYSSLHSLEDAQGQITAKYKNFVKHITIRL